MNESKSTKEDSTGSTVFGQLPEDKRNGIMRAMENQVLAPREIIFRQGDPGDRFYVIHSGKVRVFKKDRDGFETELSVLGPGESFGEMALLTGEARSANVEAVEETRLMVLSKEQFEGILKDFPDISLAFVKQMAGWLARADGIIEKEARQIYQARRLSWLDLLLVIGVSVALALVFNRSNPNGIPLFPKFPDRKATPEISADRAMEEVKKGEAVIVDAGPENFYEKKHIQGAISMPLSLFDLVYVTTFGGEDKGKKVIVYGGTFSKLYDWELAEKLLLRDHKDVKVLEGGMAAWERKSYPVEKGGQK
jgi:CRP-like cAMP-binding protein/rhodanese-related sulfurtransferase